MRICLTVLSADAKEMRRQGELAFTMIEIALAIGVIGFALVAIIGILPAGMNVQKNDREDTTVSEDAPYFIDAIKNGTVVSNVGPNGTAGYVAYPSRGLDYLTNYVQLVQLCSVYPSSGGGLTTNINGVFSNFYSGAEIVGLLTTPVPQSNYLSPYFASNFFFTRAIVRALNGPATAQQGGGGGQMNSFMAFTYQMDVMVIPFNSFALDTTNWYYYASIPNIDPNQVIIRSNRWLEANPFAATGPSGVTLPPAINMNQGPGVGALGYNLFDISVRFSWPVIMNGSTVQSVGPRHQTYHTMVSAALAEAYTNIDGGVYTWYFQPQNYTNIMVGGL